MALIGISVSSLLLALSLSACRASPTGSTDVLPIRISTRTALSASGIANVHLRDEQPHAQKRAIDVTYGACAELNKFQSDHKLGGLYPRSGKNLSRRLVWLIPRDVKSGGCLSVWDGETGELLGRSEALTIGEESKLKMKRDGISMGPENGIDTTGPWFDGVEYLKSKNLTEVETEKAKNKSKPPFLISDRFT